jgi:hypothetical protein
MLLFADGRIQEQSEIILKDTAYFILNNSKKTL